ncbi:MAG: bifunctional glutamate N-acetyltransferase/amino-acid acetyltransferase ArgJ [PVC group bacterium]|nr:bifunctional glutamate N-acetyltransferase/amino-acid acetyltransferase ArgJ [PVC group bacterium]
MKDLKQGTITSPLGFKTNALWCGLKQKNPDLGLIYSIVEANAAAVFTSNKVKAAHIEIDQANLRNNSAQAVIINSGNANCCTGKKGKQDALKIISGLAKNLDIKEKSVLIASTGVIGKYLPINKIISKIPELVKGLNFNKAEKTAKAIMTTDTYPKQMAVEIKLNGKKVTIAAVAKGAGMICPNMATMLCFVTTDAYIQPKALKQALKEAVDNSFNCISVDGEMSTNDTVAVLANGLAGNTQIKDKSKELKKFSATLKYVCFKLAMMIVEDGEGANKIIQTTIKGAKSKQQAQAAALCVVNSPLVKTMIAGNNPNWGRIPASIGAAGVDFKEEKLEVTLQNKIVYKKSSPVLKDNKVLINLLKKKQVSIDINLNAGKFSHTMWGSDLTAEYVKINTEYN